ncbi:Uncharacterised protein [Klebsiella pneumoniae]|nr:Uncharacterised protein [Klebsiella pneumoniae]
MTAHEEDAQVVDVEHGQTVIRLGFHLIDFGMARELTSCQLDGFLMNWCSRDHVDQPRFAQLDRLHHIVQRHLPRQFLHLAPFDTVAIVVASFQNIQRPPAKTGLLRMGNFMDSKIAAHDFHRPADNRYRADQERFALVIHAFVHHGGHGDLRADPCRIANGNRHNGFFLC